jgi:hypothetical protein
MKYILTTALLLFGTLLFAQNQDQGAPFAEKLKKVTSKDSIALCLKEINAINTIQRKDTSTKFDENSKWKLRFHRVTGWKENMPNQRHDINILEIGKNDIMVTGKDILNVFQRFKQKVTLLNQFPSSILLTPRGAPLNGAFILVLLDDDNAVLQYTHSYPNGNQSSWYITESYYFKKN